jgi:adenine-specific DNA-methyltransferase
MGWNVIGQTNKTIRPGKLQRTLRNNMSDAEQALWHLLRRRQISGLKFRRQHPFGNYILDFVCLENRLVIELDGGQHVRQAGYDENRTQKLRAAGFRVIRFWDNEVLKEIESVREKIWLVVQELQSHPPSNLPLEGGGFKEVSPERKRG